MKFTKMHGLGNDFIMVDSLNNNLFDDLKPKVRMLCDRHFGVGADGVIFVLPSKELDVSMRIINSDGSEAEMCGNGIRCFAKYIYENGIIKKTKIKVDTMAGMMIPELIIRNRTVEAVRVNMGKPGLERQNIPMTGSGGPVIEEPLQVLDTSFKITCVSMGNPHCVIFTDDLDSIDHLYYGPAIENHPVFPRKTNVEFIQKLSDKKIKMKVWERGAGETLACGTGACAAAVASSITGRTGRQVTVGLAGGELEIKWDDDNAIYMTGPAETVYTGEIVINTGMQGGLI